MAQKQKSSDSGNWNIPKRRYKKFPLIKKVKSHDLKRKKKLYAEIAKI